MDRYPIVFEDSCVGIQPTFEAIDSDLMKLGR